MRKRTGYPGLVSAGVLVVLFASIHSGSAAERSLSGQVTDDGGTGLAGATIYLTALAGDQSMTMLRTASDGRFWSSAPSGRYLLAALKPGYDVALTEINLGARGVIELRLRQAARTVLGDLPNGAREEDLGLDWILRRPDADVLRDIEPAVHGDDEEAAASRSGQRGAARGWLEAILEPLEGRLVQNFSGGSLLDGEESGPGDTSGRTTSLALRGTIGEQGNWNFDGLLGRSSVEIAPGRSARQGQEGDRVEVGLDYRLGPRDDLRAEVRYGTDRFVIDPDGGTMSAMDQEQRTTGVRSRWDRRVGAGGLLYVDGSYWEAGVRMPGSDPLVPSPASQDRGGIERVIDSQWLTTAGLAVEVDRHRLDLGIRAKAYRYDLRDQGVLVHSIPEAPTLVESGERGNAMSLFGHDDWRVAERYVLNLGLRYHSSLSAGEAYFVPRVGMTREPVTEGGMRVRSMLLFRIDDPGLSSLYSSTSARRAAQRRDLGRFGYQIGFERRPANKTQLAAALSYRPFEERIHAADAGPTLLDGWSDPVLLLTDGGAGRHDLGIELQRGFGGFHGSLTGSVGRVSGRLTPTLEEAPIQILSTGEARYYLTQLRACYGPSETEFEINYRRVTGEATTDVAGGPIALDYRRFDLVVYQDLSFMRDITTARFKVLMAYQGLAYGALYDGAASDGPGTTASRIAGGVDISF